MKINWNRNYSLWLFLMAVGFYIPFIGNVHLFDWDEINFAESSREMIVSGDYFRVMIGFEPFWEKPPLFFWLQSAAMHVFGVNEFAARLPNALFGIITLLTIFYIGKKEADPRFGWLWALLYFGSFLPHLYFKSGIIDPIFNYFIFLSIYYLMRALQRSEDKLKNATIAGCASGLAILTKGPVGLLILILTLLVALIVYRFKYLPRLKDVAIFAVSAFVISFLWYGPEVINNGFWFVSEFIKYQIDLFRNPVAGHSQPFYYHFVVVLVGCFPMSVYALKGFRFKVGNNSYFNDLTIWMNILFWVVIILFTIVTTKIVHYSSMTYLPLSFIAALYISKLENKQFSIPRWILIIYLTIGCLFGLILTLVPIIPMLIKHIAPLIDDPFAVAGLVKPVKWFGWEWLIGLGFIGMVLYSFILFKKGLIYKAVVRMSFSVSSVLLLYMVFVLPKIESHTQGSLITFLEEVKNEDAYVMTHGFYSYAPFFYFQQPNENNNKRADKGWLLNGDVDKPVYIVSKITDEYLPTRNDLRLIKEEGGFRFFIRKKK